MCRSKSDVECCQSGSRYSEQFERDRRSRSAKNPIDVPDFDNLTLIEDSHAIGELSCQGKVVSDQHEGRLRCRGAGSGATR